MQIENALISIEFEDDTGSVRQITDRVRGRQVLNDSRGNRLAKLIVPTPEHMSRPLFSHEAGPPEMIRDGETLTMIFPELRFNGSPTGIFLKVWARLPQDSAEVYFRAQVRNESPHRVHELWFPWLGGRTGKPGKTRDVITTSKQVERDMYARLYQAGALTHTFGHHHQRLAYDPLHLLPMMDLSDGTGGLSYIQYEQRPSPRILVFENPSYSREDICLTWSWVTGVFVEPGQTWTSCEFGIGVHQGDWHVTADRLRSWLNGWRKPSDTPASVREKIGLLHVHTHGFSGQRYHEFAELPAIAQDAAQYGVHDLMIWDYTASIYYRPDRDGFWEMPPARRQELIRALAEVRAMGSQVTAFVNWRLLAEYNRTWEELRPLAQEGVFGIDLFGFPCGTMDGGVYNDPGYEMGSHAVCCGADGFLPYAREVLKRTFELGFDVISVDQAAEWNYCLAGDHGHASPWEAWQRTYDWFGEVTRETRARQPEAYTIAELPDLYNTQQIDVWWNWMWRDTSWANPVVFRYVLPDMIPAWCIDENQREVIAEAFALGSFLAIATRDMTGRLSDDPELAGQIERLGRLRKDTAEFVSHGKFQDNRGLAVAGGKGYVYTSERGLAVTLANGGPRRKILKVALDCGQYPGIEGMRSCLFVEGREAEEILATRDGAVLNFRFSLPAYAAGVLTLDPLLPPPFSKTPKMGEVEQAVVHRPPPASPFSKILEMGEAEPGG